ncbi:hypothetical protein AgCh_027808 [Apium graveolens]
MLTEEEWKKRDAEEGKLLLTRDEWLKRSNKGAAGGNRGTYGAQNWRDKSKEVNMAQYQDDEPAFTTRKSRIDIVSKISVVFGADVKVKVCDKMAEEKKQPVFCKVAEFRPGTYGLNLTLSLGPATYPQRPRQIECDFYMKSGECKFGERCEFHHPINRFAHTQLAKESQ